MNLALLSLALLAADEPLATRTAHLAKIVDVVFASQPIGELARKFAAEHKVALVLDPRVDLKMTAKGEYKSTPVEVVLAESARYASARMVVFGETVYFGPMETADRAAGMAVRRRAELAKRDAALRTAFLKKQVWKWDRKATCEDRARDLVRDLGFELAESGSLDVVPPAAELPAASPADVLSLWCALADRTWEIDEAAKKIVIVELPESVPLARSNRYPPQEAAARVAEYEKLNRPDLDIEASRGTVKLKGSWTSIWECDRIDRAWTQAVAAAKADAKNPKKKGVKRYTVTLKNVTLDQFVESLAEATGRDIRIDNKSLNAAEISRERIRIQCVAAGLELEQMLRLALEPVGLTYSLDGETVIIKAAKAKD
ncbi:MAG TPA: hypothetical protein VNC50_07120 [Planctomycetia bacterium]|nr:hypothetical protein [Planctomycetia bacterium]